MKVCYRSVRFYDILHRLRERVLTSLHTHVPPSFSRSRSTSHMFNAPLLHLGTSTCQIIILVLVFVQPPTLLRRRRDRRTRDPRLPGGSAASFSTVASSSTKSALDPERFLNQPVEPFTIPSGSSSSFQRAALRSLLSPHSSSCARPKAPMAPARQER